VVATNRRSHHRPQKLAVLLLQQFRVLLLARTHRLPLSWTGVLLGTREFFNQQLILAVALATPVSEYEILSNRSCFLLPLHGESGSGLLKGLLMGLQRFVKSHYLQAFLALRSTLAERRSTD
jgi:hypothetical protein